MSDSIKTKPECASACLSRRRFIRLSMLGVAGAAALPAAAFAQTPPSMKATKEQAKYVDSGGPQVCDDCVNIIRPDECDVVEGKVSLKGYCQFFSA